MTATIERPIVKSEDVECPICGNRSLRSLPDSWCETPMVYCANCPVVFQPPAQDLARDAFDQYRTGAYWARQSRVSRSVEAALLSWRLRSAATRLQEIECILGRNLIPGERVLDVGCGSGEVMHLASQRRACVVVGIEPASREAILTRTRHDLAVVTADAASLPFHGRFDVILALHVIEHVVDPIRVVRELLGSLAPGGRLVIECPNLYRPSGGMPIRRFLERAHVWTFSLQSLVNVIEQAEGRVAFRSDDGFLRLVAGSFAAGGSSPEVSPIGEAGSVGWDMVSDQKSPDAWVTLEKYQESYFRSAARMRWWWTRALLARHFVAVTSRRLAHIFSSLTRAGTGA